MSIEFTWDQAKAKINIKKHGISFEEAKTVFFDDYARIIPDPDDVTGEERFILLGMSSQLRLLTVVHCYRENDHSIRLISARKATKSESMHYAGYLS